ncbi:hypothetical protein JI723_11445 [Providencia manganoxydans]|uniref:Peptidase M66 domain-containing protein n=1 Tax=Providencia manganoxydans TaxID=2923283 RepID=A0ABX7AAE4_9GAMM|nr:hypothetical protein JI723_11445 [Providencia manganoxydans]
MLVCTICICQNQQSSILPSTIVDNSHSQSFLNLQNDRINNGQLNEIWQYLLEHHTVLKTLDLLLNNQNLSKNTDKENKHYSALMLEYKKEIGKLFYFNTSEFPSDIQGELKGNVFYAQSSIIPAAYHIDDDQHPHLVADRKTLVIFKPHVKIENNGNLELKILNKDDEEIYSAKLAPPSELPRLPNNKSDFIELTPDDFFMPTIFDADINSPDLVNQISKDPSYLNHFLTQNTTINLNIHETSSPFFLSFDSLAKHPNKKIIFNIKNNVDAKIKYNNKLIKMANDRSIVMVSDADGNWHTREDARLSQHYKHALNHYTKNKTPASFDIKLDSNEKINSFSKNIEYFDEILNKNNLIKISTGDGYWAKNFNLPNGKKYSNKKILFSSQASFHSDISYGDNKIRVSTDEEQLFVSDKNGIWSIANSRYKENIDYSKPDSFSIKIDNNEQIQKISKDIEQLNKIISINDSVSIFTSDGNWASKFILDTDPKFANKKIYVSSSASYNTDIYYGDKKITIETNQSKLFVSDKFGFWRTIEDETLISNEEEIQYIENGWSTIIPKSHIKPEIKLSFHYKNKQGSLPTVKVGAPSSLLLHTIDIGMLTPYRDEFSFQDDPELHRQFLQQLPTSQLIVTKYKPVQLNEVVLPNGTRYTQKSADNGGGHSGDMREKIAKDLISDGINLANYGINSSAPNENSYLPTPQITIHNAIGNYDNGVQVHGWSGGAGKATLYNSTGNEFSHELGHNFQIGHYHKGFHGGVHAHANHKNSTWGWDSDNNVFIPNFEKEKKNELVYLDDRNTTNQPAAHPYKKHTMTKDAMSGGKPYDSSINAFTLYTPATTQSIQQYFENHIEFNQDSPTGYKKWDPKTQKMEDYQLSLNIVKLNIEIKNETNIDQNELNHFFNNNDYLKIHSYNGHYTPNIYIPDATQKNKGNIIEVFRESDYNMKIHVNSDKINIKHGEKLYFKSNGQSWEQLSKVIHSKKPYKQGIPVVTLIGYYDPENQLQNFITPALEGSYGMVYHPDAENQQGAFLRITLANGQMIDYKLNRSRVVNNKMNKFHINIERKLSPIKAELFIKGKSILTQEIQLDNEELTTTINGITQ